MTKRRENLTYLVLFFVCFGLLAYLVVDAATVYRGEDINPSLLPRPIDNEFGGEASGVADNAIFEQRDPLFPIVTPEPTPTIVIVPTPTETKVDFMKWDIIAILGTQVMFKDESGKVQHRKQGDEHFGVKLIEVNAKDEIIVGQFYLYGRTNTFKRTKP